MTKRKLQWLILGVYYGYPECCIQYFCTRKHTLLTLSQHIVNTACGFVPCVECSYKIIDYSIDNDIKLDTTEGRIAATKSIIQNRYCMVPFKLHADL